MAADVVGYSRMMEQAEEATASQLYLCQDLIAKEVENSGGRVFNRAGDAAFAEFSSPINALRSAVAIREELAAAGHTNGQIRLRFGLHLADVMVSGDDLIGDGVNLAARLQQDTDPDTICISETLFEQIKRHSPFAFEDLGPKNFKNLENPVRVYRLKGDIQNHRLQSAPTILAAPGTIDIQPNSVAVLPFSAAGGGDDDQQYLAEGLTEEIIYELGRFKKLHVASRSACFVYADKAIDTAQVASELGVNYVLEGQVRRLGDKVRLSVQLVSGQSAKSVWAERFTRGFEDLFDLMDEVTTQIAATILGRLEADAIETARRKPPDNMTAYDYLLRGLDKHRVGGVTHENARKAVSWFDQAIEADPNYGPAYAWRICASSWLPEFNLEEERFFIDKALELDANDPEAQRIMGVIQMINGDFEASAYHHERAIELSPCDAYILARSAAFFTFNGQPELALQSIEKAIALDALLPVWCVEERGIALFGGEKYEEAITALKELPFQTYRSRVYQCAALAALGRTDEANQAMRQALAINPELSSMSFMRKETWRDLKKRKGIVDALVDAGMPR